MTIDFRRKDSIATSRAPTHHSALLGKTPQKHSIQLGQASSGENRLLPSRLRALRPRASSAVHHQDRLVRSLPYPHPSPISNWGKLTIQSSSSKAPAFPEFIGYLRNKFPTSRPTTVRASGATAHCKTNSNNAYDVENSTI